MIRDAASVVVVAAGLFAFFAAMIWVFSTLAFADAFGWAMDHPVITGVVFCTTIAAMMVIGSK